MEREINRNKTINKQMEYVARMEETRNSEKLNGRDHAQILG